MKLLGYGVGPSPDCTDSGCGCRFARCQPSATMAVSHERGSMADRIRTVWAAEDDAAARASLLAAGAKVDYVDIQMQRNTMVARQRTPPPLATRLVALAGPNDLVTLGALHELTCRAWKVEPWWEGFLDRFVNAAGFDPAYVVLLAPDTHDGGALVAAALGRRGMDTPDSELGVVSHVDVDPAFRRQGLGTWVLEELLRRFARNGIARAQLGVHADNASGAPGLYRRLGWIEVSRTARWSLPG